LRMSDLQPSVAKRGEGLRQTKLCPRPVVIVR
jgi:hypothetical protein